MDDYIGWLDMRMLLAGIDKGGTADATSIVKGLETARLSEGIYYRDWDHQLMHLVVAVREGAHHVEIGFGRCR